MPNIVPSASNEIARTIGKTGRVTKANMRDLLRRIASNELTDDDIATLRAIIEKETNDLPLTAAEDEAFRRLSARILSERSLRGDVEGFRRQRVETPFDDLYAARDRKFGRDKEPQPRRDISGLLE